MNDADTQLKHDVEQELRWEPSLNAAQVSVSVSGGNVTLLGSLALLESRLEPNREADGGGSLEPQGAAQAQRARASVVPATYSAPKMSLLCLASHSGR